jgi:hypothetical protein
MITLRELGLLGTVFVVMNIILGFLFSDSAGTLLALTGSLWYIAVLPGFFMLSIFSDYFTFLERLIMGSALGGITTGTISFYLARLGWKVYGQQVLPALLLLLFGAIIVYRNRTSEDYSRDKKLHNTKAHTN